MMWRRRSLRTGKTINTENYWTTESKSTHRQKSYRLFAHTLIKKICNSPTVVSQRRNFKHLHNKLINSPELRHQTDTCRYCSSADVWHQYLRTIISDIIWIIGLLLTEYMNGHFKMGLSKIGLRDMNPLLLRPFVSWNTQVHTHTHAQME